MLRANSWLRPLAAGGLLALALAACGESESNSNGSNTDGSGGTAPTGDGGTANTSTGGANSDGGTSGAGGTTTAGGGTSSEPQSAMCDGMLCEGLELEILGLQTDACCPDDPEVDPCGVRTDFLEMYDINLDRECQPLNSPGELDENCPDSPPLRPSETLSLPGFPGCCLPSGKCGFLLDEALLGAVQLNLGCIDSRELPNPDFDDPPDCDPGPSGAGGAP